MVDKPDFGTVRACPKCKRGNVNIRKIQTLTIESEMTWDEDSSQYKLRSVNGPSETVYSLECGHNVYKEEALEMETPKFIRWYPQED